MGVIAEMVVMQATREAEIAEVCGPKGKHDPDGAAVRHGSRRGSVTLGARVAVDRPQARILPGERRCDHYEQRQTRHNRRSAF